MQMILNPSKFDVILAPNLFGDIISDQASVIGGSIGLITFCIHWGWYCHV